MIQLGGRIRLHGFEALDHAELLIAKKLVGGYIRSVCDQAGGCDQADLVLERRAEGFSVQAKVRTPQRRVDADAAGENVFMTIDAALKGVLEKLGINDEG